jgi:hypothetical protein
LCFPLLLLATSRTRDERDERDEKVFRQLLGYTRRNSRAKQPHNERKVNLLGRKIIKYYYSIVWASEPEEGEEVSSRKSPRDKANGMEEERADGG